MRILFVFNKSHKNLVTYSICINFLKNSLGVTDSSYTNTRAELSLEVGRVVSHWGRVVLGRVVGGPSCLPTHTDAACSIARNASSKPTDFAFV